MKCVNCNDEQLVSVSIPCPSCKGNNINEIDALRSLAIWVEMNFKKRSRPPIDGLRILQKVKKAQGVKEKL